MTRRGSQDSVIRVMSDVFVVDSSGVAERYCLVSRNQICCGAKGFPEASTSR